MPNGVIALRPVLVRGDVLLTVYVSPDGSFFSLLASISYTHRVVGVEVALQWQGNGAW